MRMEINFGVIEYSQVFGSINTVCIKFTKFILKDNIKLAVHQPHIESILN
jgi:hypothetical protein